MSVVARQPLDPQAVRRADDQFYANHPEFVVNGRRVPLESCLPSQARLRAEWMRLYEANGGEVVRSSTPRCGQPAAPCGRNGGGGGGGGTGGRSGGAGGGHAGGGGGTGGNGGRPCPPPPAEQRPLNNGLLWVRVVDQQSGQPVSFATAILLRDGAEVQRQQTWAGEAFFEVAGNQTYTAAAEHSAYWRASSSPVYVAAAAEEHVVINVQKRPLEKIVVWINAFIPRVVSGYTQTVPGGPHQGKTMIPGPFPGSDCYLTDQRGFSDDPAAKARMHSEATITVDAHSASLSQTHRCDQTTEVDCEDGEVECTAHGNTGRMRYYGLSRNGNIVTVQVEAAANNPCAPSSALGGDIDYNGTITIDLDNWTLAFNGAVDAFPAFEMYAAANDDGPVPVFRLNPPEGNTVMDLPGGATRGVQERVVFSPSFVRIGP